MTTDAYFSQDRKYRYWLVRIWDMSLPMNCSCGVNPSSANESENDPTIRKDIGFLERQGFGGLLKLNLAAYVSTNPKVLPCLLNPIGNENTPAFLRKYFDLFKAQQFTAAWGKNGNYLRVQARKVLEEFPQAVCFGKNPDGTPRHTLMLAYSTQLQAI